MCSLTLYWLSLPGVYPVDRIILVSDSGRPDISSPIRSIKMYSYAQCTVQERLVCCGDVPCLPIWSRDLAPSTLSTYPPFYLPGVMGTQFTGSLQDGWISTVEWRFAASPTQIQCFWIMYAILSLFHLESCFWSVYKMIGCLVLIAVIFLCWLTTTRNKRVSSCAFITFSWAVSRTILLVN